MSTTREPQITRRETLVNTLKAVLTTALAAPIIAQTASAEMIEKPVTEFAPENDYPFFGWNPESASSETETN